MNTISAWLEAAFLGNQAVYALGWTLLHSLWQGGALALMVIIGQWILRKHSANARYLVALCGLVAMFLTSVATLFYYLQALNEAVHWADKNSMVALHILQSSSQASLLLKAKIFINQHLVQIVGFWSVGFAIYFSRYLGSYVYCQNLRRSKVYAAPAEWSERVQQLAQTMGIASPVMLRISRRVHSPCVIGHFKPLVLVPAALFTHMGTREIEAILSHELAHIRRHDYLIGLCQGLVKVIYFFNPFIVWISSRADSERENACDDIAVDRCKDRMLYARALEAFTSIPQNGGLVMAATGNKQYMFSRVRRLFGDGATKSKPLEGLVASLVIALSCVAVSLHANASKDDPSSQNYPGIQSLSSIETTDLLDSYTRQIVNKEYPNFTTSINLEQRLSQMSRDERAIFVGHLKERVWQETYADFERPENFQHLSDERWIGLKRLWLDDNYGHLFGYIEAPTKTSERIAIVPNDGTPGVQGKMDREGERMEFIVPVDLIRKLKNGVGAIGDDSAQVLLNENGDLVILIDPSPEGKTIDEAPKHFTDRFSNGDLRASTIYVAGHFSNDFELIEIKREFLDKLMSGEEEFHGNGGLGAQLDDKGNIAIVVEPRRYSANRDDLLKYLSPSVFQVSPEHKAEVEKKLAQLSAEQKALLQTPEEWERWRLVQDLRAGEPISDQHWAVAKNRFLNHRLDMILNSDKDDPYLQRLLSGDASYTLYDGIYIATRDPSPKPDEQSVFDIDFRQKALSEAVEHIRSHCPDDSFNPALAQDVTPVTVVAHRHTCDNAQTLLGMIAEHKGVGL